MIAAPAQSKPWWIAATLLLYAAVYIAPLGLRPLSSPDEVRYGAIAHEMIVSGDWVAPRFNGARYFEKPALGYWLDAASMRLLGESRLALRLPGAIATGLTALIVWLFTVRYVSVYSGLVASSVYLTTFLVTGVGTTALPDAFLALFLTGALASYYMALTETRARSRLLSSIGCGACCAGAFLTKGFLGLAIPVIIAGPYLLARRDWRALLTSGWVPIATAVALALPWALMIALREPDFWRYFFWVEHVQRFAGEQAQHAAPAWYYFARLPVAAWPWLWMIPAAFIGLRERSESRSLLLYLAAWTVLPWLFFSVSRGKLMTYVLPCFAPFAILLAAGLEQYFQSGHTRAWRVGAAAVGSFTAAVLALVLLTQSGIVGEAPYGADESGRVGILVGCLALGVVAAAIASRSRSSLWRPAAVALAGIVAYLPTQAALPQHVLDNLMPRGFVTADMRASAASVLVADARMFGAVAWYSKRDDIYVLDPGEIAYGLAYPDDRKRNLADGGLPALIEANRGQREVVIVSHDDLDPTIASQIPNRARRTQVGRVVIWRIPA